MDSQSLQTLKNKFDIIGNDAALNLALETAVCVAPSDLTVLITGESGVGKDAIPSIIHSHSRRKTGKYLAVNCGAIPEGTISAELFGHEKGSFTGAVSERKGYFEEANGGTLFLDEIGELPKETQAMLLRVLQTGEYIKVGSSKVEKTDVRVIAATNANLAHLVATGKFREDLYYRLNAIQIKMPSLRERKDDIYLLFRKFSSDFCSKYNLCRVALTHEAISLLRSYRWPGNIRQLKNITEAISALESKPATPLVDRVEIDANVLAGYLPDEKDTLLPAPAVEMGGGSSSGMSSEDKRMFVKVMLDMKQEIDALKDRVASLEGGASAPAVASHKHHEVASSQESIPEDQFVDEVEWQEPEKEDLSLRKRNDDLITRALEKHSGNVKLAAAELGLSERTLYRKLAKRKAE